MNGEIWEHLVAIHNKTKSIFIFAEELEFDDFLTFVQPVSELRHAHVHLMRWATSKLGRGKRSHDEEYQQDCLKAALRHEVRGFFDSADWLSVLLRKGIRERLTPYSHDCICNVLRDYYPKQRPRIDAIAREITERRQQKDGADVEHTAKEIELYKDLLDELEQIFREVVQAASSLEDYRQKEKEGQEEAKKRENRQQVSNRIWSVWTGVVAGLIVVLISFIAGWVASMFWRT